MSNNTEYGTNGDNSQSMMDEEITPERQLKIAKKYGVSEIAIKTISDEKASDEDRTSAYEEILKTLGDALDANRIAIQDRKIVTSIVGPRF